MRILYTTEQYPPCQTGVALADYGLSLALAQAGHEVFVCTGQHPQATQEGEIVRLESGRVCKEAALLAPRLWVLRFDVGWDWSKSQQPIGAEVKDYVEFVLNFDCALLLNSGIIGKWNCDLLYQVLPQAKAKVKFLRSHGEKELIGFKYSLKSRFKDLLRSLCTGRLQKPYMLWLNQELQRSLKHYDKVFFLHENTHGYAPLKPFCTQVGILPNGVFAKDICPPKNFKPTFLLNVSNYFVSKGQDFVLKAYYLSKTPLPLKLIGALEEGQTLEKLKALKAQLDKEHGKKEVEFLYKIPREQILQAFKEACIFLHASHFEAFPMVILECLQFATPFVCTDVGNVAKIAPHLIAHTPQEMADKIDTLLSDPTHYAEVSKALRTMAQDFCYENIAKGLLTQC
ncbi:glycosyltransferase family 4 protein [Helicobacter ailurogastricus]|uniref:glycosyltransferase family 4 protein n=1 Tax=Helicobacter ailurogastricus TaxID=1578720 RepID=UPI0022CBCAFD|nr:glycosyltransferase family 4 protein [Helicobacter ailurogastricus]GLH57931.1 hypothetical protein NHP214376_07190 [Helicobacter ailurogastricus]GLH59448.1 hypothetical protein NHP214377_07150 [Helicobacter ailurogastricus]